MGGDVASGPFPVETLAALDALPQRVVFVRGNADRVLDFPEGLPELRMRRHWVADRLGEAALGRLAALPLDVTLEVSGLGRVRFCHGAPGSDEEVVTRATPEPRLRALLRGVDEDVVVVGHTHMQFDRTIDGVRVVNAGSVGYPYEARPGAYWLALGPDVDFRHTPYDVHSAAARILAPGHPDAEGVAGQIALDDPAQPERMTAAIEAGV